MKKTVIAIGAALSISGVLAGCGATNTAAPNAATDNVRMRNVGYYTDQGLNYRDARLQTYRNAQHADRFNQGVGRDTNNVAPYTEPLSYESSNTALARRIATRVDQIKGIRSSQVIVTRQRVVVGANVSNRAANTPKLHRQIKSAVTPYAAGRTIQITTDRRLVGRITNVSNRLNAGAATRETRTDIAGIISDLGRGDLNKAARRPFENNVK